MPIPPLSDDELHARIEAAFARADVEMPLLFLSMVPVLEQSIHVFAELGETMTRLLDVTVAGLTPEQRSLYNQLVACGTPCLDVACEAAELAP